MSGVRIPPAAKLKGGDMKRKERREIKEDELTSLFVKITDFLSKRKKEAVIIGIVLGVLIIVWSGYTIIKSSLERKDNKNYLKIIELTKTKDKAFKNEKLILKLSKKGKLSKAGYFILAEYYISSGNNDKALEIVEKIPNSSDLNGFKKNLLKFEILFSKNEYNKIVDLYRSGKIDKFIEDNKKFPADELLYYVALCYEKLNQPDSAKKIWLKIKNEYPYSPKAMLAGIKL